ncbi:MAG: CoF synthetase [Actinobacteria bacterium]|nr:CoF synthetase [Actinomycetota bacterium]
MKRLSNRLRYLLTRFFFCAMGLQVNYWRNRVENLWLATDIERKKEQEQLLIRNRPLNADGTEVTNIEELSKSPLLSKQMLRVNAKKTNSYQGRRFNRHTAGTTGESTSISVIPEELGRMLGVRDYCFRKWGFRLGEREARLWGRPEKGLKSWCKNFILNRRVFHPVGSETETEVRDLLKWEPEYIYGYSSLLLEAAKVIQHLDIRFKSPKCVICTAEAILPTQKEYLSTVFGAPVAEEYGSTEFDVIAFECHRGHRHIVNPWLYVENSSDSCIISDCSRRSLDIIRYDAADVIRLELNECREIGSEVIVTLLEGRSVNQFAYASKGSKFHAVHFGNLSDKYMNENSDVFGIKVVQLEYGSFEVIVTSVPKKGLLDLEQYIKRYIKYEVGYDITVKCTNEDRFPVTKQSYFISNLTLS